MNTLNKIASGVAAVLLLPLVAGCSSDENRTVTKEEAAAADVKRQAAIDDLKIPEAQKAAMKAHLGGPPVADPAAAARASADKQPGRRN